MPKPLGKTQLDVLDYLRHCGSGRWYEGCGWTWSNTSETTRIMESLLKRGLVTKSQHEDHRSTTVYTLVKESV